MKKIKLLLLAIVAVALFTPCAHGRMMMVDSPIYNTYHGSEPFVKACELLAEYTDDEEVDSVIHYLSEELSLHPTNGYARVLLGMMSAGKTIEYYSFEIRDDDGVVDQFMLASFATAMQKHLDMVDKGYEQIPAADKENRAKALFLEGVMYYSIDEFEEKTPLTHDAQVVSSLRRSVDLDPEDYNLQLFLRYYRKYHEDTFAADMSSYIDLYYNNYPADEDAVLLKLVQLQAQGNENDQILAVTEQYFNSSNPGNIVSDIAEARINALVAVGRDEEALDDILRLIDADNVNDVDYIEPIKNISRRNADLALAKLGQHKFASTDDNHNLDLATGYVYYYGYQDYDKAIECFKQAKTPALQESMCRLIARTYMLKGDEENALLYAEVADNASTDVNQLSYKQMLNYQIGHFDELISWLNKRINLMRADEKGILTETYLLNRDYASAASGYAELLAKRPNWGDGHYHHGVALAKLGKKKEAQREFQAVLTSSFGEESDDSLYLTTAAQLSLGNKKAAMPMLEQFVKNYDTKTPLDNGYLATAYQVAKLYSLAGDKAKALKYLEEHFLKDGVAFNFGLMEKDYALDNIRESKEYKALVEKYYTMWKSGKLPARE